MAFRRPTRSSRFTTARASRNAPWNTPFQPGSAKRSLKPPEYSLRVRRRDDALSLHRAVADARRRRCERRALQAKALVEDEAVGVAGDLIRERFQILENQFQLGHQARETIERLVGAIIERGVGEQFLHAAFA